MPLRPDWVSLAQQARERLQVLYQLVSGLHGKYYSITDVHTSIL